MIFPALRCDNVGLVNPYCKASSPCFSSPKRMFNKPGSVTGAGDQSFDRHIIGPNAVVWSINVQSSSRFFFLGISFPVLSFAQCSSCVPNANEARVYLFRTVQDRTTFERVLLYITSEKHLRPFGRYLLSEPRSGSGSPSAVQSDLLSKYEKKLRM